MLDSPYMLHIFLSILDIFDDKSINLTYRNKKMAEPNGQPKVKFKYNLG